MKESNKRKWEQREEMAWKAINEEPQTRKLEEPLSCLLAQLYA